MVTRDEILDAVRAVLSEGRECTADNPHEGKLRYTRGNPGAYLCECGKRYQKDGRGGLVDAPGSG